MTRSSRHKITKEILTLNNMLDQMDFVIQLLSGVQLLATPWTAACQASLSFTISQSLLKLMSIELMVSSNHLVLCHPLFLLPSIFPTIRVFSNVSSSHQVAKVLEHQLQLNTLVRFILITISSLHSVPRTYYSIGVRQKRSI